MYKSKSYIAIPPGVTIKEQLETREMTQKEFALRMDMSEKHISNLLNGKVELTANVANRLESVLGLPSSFWLNLEGLYREQLAKVQDEISMDEEIELAKQMPYNNMAKLGWVKKTRINIEKVYNLRRFFEVSRLSILEHLKMPGIAYRVNCRSEKNNYALAAWAQKAKCEAESISTESVNIQKIITRLQAIRSLTLKEPEEFCCELKTMLAECGVAVVFLPHLNGSYLQGASFYDKKKIVMGLTVRGRTADIFWFSLFHELYHIIEGHINNPGDTTIDEERLADEFARDTLIPPEFYNEFINQGIYDKETICLYAKKMRIPPGILLGRLQKENIVSYRLYNDLKERYSIQ